MKILPILATFSSKDWHWLEKFIQSPLYNQHVAVQKLFSFFRKKAHVDKKTYSSEFLHKKIFPESPFEPAKIHHTANYLLRNTESYLAWQEWSADVLTQQRYLLQAYRHRGLSRHFTETLDKTVKICEQKPQRDAEFYRFNYHLSMENYLHTMQSGQRSTIEQLKPLSYWHDVAFVAEKLKNACGLLSRQRVLSTELDLGLLPAVLDFVRARPQLLEHPAVAVYFYGYHTLSEPENEAHFDALQQILVTDADKFPLSELRDIYLLAINFCIHHINMRQEKYLRAVFELYKSGLDSQIFLENDQISKFTYTNITLTALRLEEFDWAYQFLQANREKLPEAQRLGTYSFNLARYFCERGDYNQAMPLLLEMDFDDVLHNLTAKAMLAKMYWETAEWDALESLLGSLSAYMRRKRQVSEQQRTAYQNFIRFAKKIQSLPPRQKEARTALREEILATTLLAEKDWLLRRL